jgi:hypothetical protein
MQLRGLEKRTHRTFVAHRGNCQRTLTDCSAWSQSRSLSPIRARLGLSSSFRAGSLEDGAAGVTDSVGGTRWRAADASGWVERRSWVVLDRGAPRIVGRPAELENQLHMGVARWLCPGHRPERSAWLDGHARVLLTPARCHDLPPPARVAGPSWPRRASGEQYPRLWPAVLTLKHAALPADDAVASHRAAGGDGPSIEGARTCAGGTTRGAVGRCERVSAPSQLELAAVRPGDQGLAPTLICRRISQVLPDRIAWTPRSNTQHFRAAIFCCRGRGTVRARRSGLE